MLAYNLKCHKIPFNIDGIPGFLTLWLSFTTCEVKSTGTKRRRAFLYREFSLVDQLKTQ